MTDSMADSINVTLSESEPMRIGTSIHDQLRGTDAAELIQGLAGNDTLEGAGGNDSLYGGEGNDLLFAFFTYEDQNFDSEWFVRFGSDIDHLHGGSGNDVYVMDAWVRGELGQVIITENANEGLDTIVGSVSKLHPSYQMPLEVEVYINDTSLTDNGKPIYVEITGNSGANVIQTSPASWATLAKLTSAIDETRISFEKFFGGDGNDTLKSGAGDDFLAGDDGNDQLFAGAGSDTLTGGAGNDLLDGGAGEDTALFTDAKAGLKIDLAKGVAGTDKCKSIEHLIAGPHADALTGSKDANAIDGGSGNDTLDGGLGRDTLTGGDGADVFMFSTKLGVSNIDLIDFQPGIDRLGCSRKLFKALKPGMDAFASGYLVYDSISGIIRYDADGPGSKTKPVDVAVIGAGLALSATDIMVL